MEKEHKKHGFSIGTAMVIVVAAIYILLGLAKILIPDFKTVYIIYIASFIFDVFGIIMIIKYCLSGGFNDIGKFEFSGGVLALLCGILMVVRVNTINNYFYLFIGICILLTAIIKLQNSVDLRALDHSAWFVFLIISMLFIALSIVIILDPANILKKYGEYIFYLLIIDGAFQIFSTIFVAIALFIHGRRKDRPDKPEKKHLFGKKSDSEEEPDEDDDDNMSDPAKEMNIPGNEKEETADADHVSEEQTSEE